MAIAKSSTAFFVIVLLSGMCATVATCVLCLSRDGDAKSHKFDDYCVEIRSNISSNIDFAEQDKALAFERFSLMRSHVERCSNLSMKQFDVCHQQLNAERCMLTFMEAARRAIARP